MTDNALTSHHTFQKKFELAFTGKLFASILFINNTDIHYNG